MKASKPAGWRPAPSVHRLGRGWWLAVAFAVQFAGAAWGAAPATPTNLSVSATYPSNGVGLARWTWSDNSNDEDGFVINRSVTGPNNNFNPYITGIPSNWTAVVSYFDFIPGNPQYFRIKAYKGIEESAPSASFQLVVPVSTTFNAPSNALATATSESVVNLSWRDNSTSEEYFYIEFRELPSGSFVEFNPLWFNTTNVTISGYCWPNFDYEFRVRASKGSPEVFTPYSNVAAVHVPFNGPTGLTATNSGERAVLLQWQDNSQQEGGYEIQARIQGTSPWAHLFYAPANATSTTIDLDDEGHPYLPYRDTTYEFRVIAAYQLPDYSIVDSAPSNVASATTPFHEPSNLQAVATGGTTVDLTWQDNSQVETGYQVLVRAAGDTQWTVWEQIAANATAYTVAELLPNADLEFAVRAYHTVFESADIIYSDLSNVASATTPFHTPSNLQAAAAGSSTVGLTWQDNSQVETGYQILVRAAGATQWTLWDEIAANATAYSVDYLQPGSNLEFAVRAYHVIEGTSNRIYSQFSSVAAAATRDAFLGRGYEPIQFGMPFSYSVQTTTNAPRQSLAVNGLPGGLNFNPATAVINGTPAVSGVFQVPMQAVFQGGWTNNATLTLRIVRPAAAPVAGVAITNYAFAAGGNASIPLADKFSDPDSEAAVRMSTSLGDIDILLYPSETPQTVTNFLGYASRGDYDGVSIHRSIPAFVVQGGGYEATSEPDNFTHIPTQPSPPNEPGVSNLRATIAMAKHPSNPNSATSEFFFNLVDNNDPGNPSSLDNQNGGFTAFGRVAAPGMSVVDAMAALPRGNYSINLDGTSTDFDDWPMDVEGSAPATIDQSKLVLINSVAPVPLLAHAVTGNSNPGAVSAEVTGGQLNLNGLAPGASTITITATDLDGSSVSQSFQVVVNGNFQNWASGSSFPGGLSAPGDDGDRDGLNNVQEFAFLGNPNLRDAGAAGPALYRGGGDWGMTFQMRKFADGLSYRVLASTNLVSWRTVWSSADGLSLPNVEAQDQGDRYRVTVEDPAPPPGARRYFLRVEVESTPP